MIVGASNARPPKNGVIRISRRKTSRFSLRRQFLMLQNLRAANGRPYIGFFDTLKKQRLSALLFLCFFFFLRVQGIHHDIGVGIGDDGAVGVIDHHAGFAVWNLLHLLHSGHIHGDVLAAGGF